MKKVEQDQRWGSNTRKDCSESGRDIILDAAIHCYQKSGVAGTTIDDIANEAKISRRTVYRYFANKQEIIHAVVEEQAEEFFKGMNEALSQYADNFSELLKNCILYTIENGPKAPGHQLLLGSDNAAISSQHYFNSRNIYKHWEMILLEPFEQAIKNGNISKQIRFDDLMSWCGRITFSYIQFPDSKKAIERQIDCFLTLQNLHY